MKLIIPLKTEIACHISSYAILPTISTVFFLSKLHPEGRSTKVHAPLHGLNLKIPAVDRNSLDETDDRRINYPRLPSYFQSFLSSLCTHSIFFDIVRKRGESSFVIVLYLDHLARDKWTTRVTSLKVVIYQCSFDINFLCLSLTVPRSLPLIVTLH